jgi:hypothetical protein
MILPLQHMLYVVPTHVNTTFSPLLHAKIPDFTQISREAFSIRWCNSSKSLISAAYTKVFRCPHSQISRGLS